MQNIAEIDILNRSTYAREDVLDFYHKATDLLPAERSIFERLESEIRNKRILDLGVGGGRTTGYLLGLTDDYTGVDYVPEFAALAAQKFPKARMLAGDARDLEHAADGSYDFVLFSYNGLDSISHEDRLRVLSEVRRVLKPNGIFMFSSHNRDYRYFRTLPWHQPFRLEKRFLIFLLHCIYHFPKHFKMRRYEVFADEYAIINDGDHRFSLMLYYIGIDAQRRQLAEHGFDRVESFDFNGDPVENDTESHWIYYVARRVPDAEPRTK